MINWHENKIPTIDMFSSQGIYKMQKKIMCGQNIEKKKRGRRQNGERDGRGEQGEIGELGKISKK